MKVLVTGGTGYIGSHTLIELMAANFDVCVVDNLCNSSAESLARVEKITGKKIPFYKNDVTDRNALRNIFEQEKNIEGVIHFAGLKAVGESNTIPLRYYHVNVEGSIAITEVMNEFGAKHLLFSSSATVYGDPHTVPIQENFPTGATNPYGRSKLMVEEILQDTCKAPNNALKVGLLRYFNPIGAHHSGAIGEDPKGIPNNLLPFVAQVAVGKLKQLKVFGNDYATPDGTGVRDYIHVVDLARGHVAALKKLTTNEAGSYVWNLGTGRGYSVLEVVKAFEKVSGVSIPLEIVARRAGDIAACYADPSFALGELGWSAEFDIERMVADTWRWQSSNPNGYQD
ncbi:MAG: UDP-glucose 4-epimerase GalE [Marinagarivorans sp.]|nr:UDP-glucose 4-epimerase GalE [Marinagarivorans sp.]